MTIMRLQAATGRRALACCAAAAGVAAALAAPLADRARAAERLQFEIVRAEAPVSMEPGSTLTIPIEVRNTGSEAWRAHGRVRVSYHWLRPGGAALVRDGARTPMPRDVPPGETVTVCARVDVPGEAGRLVLEWDLLEEGVGWVSGAQPVSRFLHPVTIGVARARGPIDWWLAARAALLLAATAGHFLLVALWLTRFGLAARDAGRLAFASAVIGLGSLQAVLHGLAVTAGLSLAAGLTVLALLHLAVGVAAVRRGRAGADAPAPAGPQAEPAPRVLSLAGATVVAALAIDWVIAASSSFRVAGADAAHYHVPHAVDFALGTSPFGLLATPHVYPMGTSILMAWFILPFRDALLVDLAILLPFLLAWFSSLRLLRLTTGASGLAWGPWVALVLFSLPLVRGSLQVSADLFYAAAFLALNAQLLETLVARRITRIDLLCLAFAAGMLLGSKTAGTFSTVALLGVYGVAGAGAWLAGRRVAIDGLGAWSIAAAAAAALASGGVWLVRNWVQYGSPLAPAGLSILGVQVFEGPSYASSMYYLSVLQDMRERAGYDVAGRLVHWIREWLGAWFLPAGLLLVVQAVDAWRQWRSRGTIGTVTRARLVFIGASAVLTAVHFALIAGAPWSSLERSNGFSLRYLLPFFALYLLAAASCCWPESMRWTSRPLARRAAAVLLPVASIGWYVWRQEPRGLPFDDVVARLTPTSVAIAVVAAGLAVALVRGTRGLVRAALAAAAVLVLSAAGAVHAAAMRGHLAATAESALRVELQCSLAGADTAGDHRRVYLQALASERAAGAVCAAHRFFVATRFDLPLELQSPGFDNIVYDARGLEHHPAVLRRVAPGSEPCDYVIASRADLATDHGVPLVDLVKRERGFRQLGVSGNFALFGPPASSRGARSPYPAQCRSRGVRSPYPAE
jgi:hypothetical protein